MSEYSFPNSGFAINSSLRRLFTASRCTEFHHVLNRKMVHNLRGWAVVGLLSPRDFGPTPTLIGLSTNKSLMSTSSEVREEPVMDKISGEHYSIPVSYPSAFTRDAR